MNTPHATGKMWELFNGDCLHVMRNMAEESVDSIVTDPPYGLSFMGKDWDRGVPGSPFWVEALRVAKPGAHLLAFGGTRMFHRLACAIEDAGWEIRDCVMWVHGMGFPKSHNIGKAIDRERGAERSVIGDNPNNRKNRHDGIVFQSNRDKSKITVPATDDAARWEGWGTALKPAWEPVLVCRKPIAAGMTVAGNVVRYGTGAMNVESCRVGKEGGTQKVNIKRGEVNGARAGTSFGKNISFVGNIGQLNKGRWPANVVHDGSEEVMRLMPDDGNGSTARFFYCAKADATDRDEGCDSLPLRDAGALTGNVDGSLRDDRLQRRNNHPTVKPNDLMRWLCRLVTPPGGTVLDPFMGSGSTGKAAIAEGFRFVGIDLSTGFCDIAAARIGSAHNLFNA